MKYLSRFAIAASFGALAFGLSGCASIIHGTHQDVGISSNPTGASVTIDSVVTGTTPVIAKLTRKSNHIVQMELPGYQPFEATLTCGVSGWVWGNVVFGGLVGLAVDAISGGMYKLNPDQITASLSNPLAATKPAEGVYLFAVLKPEADWEKVGQLKAL
ncbi:MAG: hypothetical protein QOF42_2124 [Gammaproteobacteria bacterium]|nr:hypothetical protein [Gammaproteobacteria bacterium]